MSHTIHGKQKLINRVRRICGQIDAIERALEEEKGCLEGSAQAHYGLKANRTAQQSD